MEKNGGLEWENNVFRFHPIARLSSAYDILNKNSDIISHDFYAGRYLAALNCLAKNAWKNWKLYLCLNELL